MRIDIIMGRGKVKFSVRAVLFILAISCAVAFSGGSALAGTAVLTITSAAPPAATTGIAYSYTFAATGGTPPYSWSAALVSPDSVTTDSCGVDFDYCDAINGLTFNDTTGILSGTPFFTGVLPLIVQVTDADGRQLYLDYDLTVNGSGSSRQITNSPPSGVEGNAYSFRFTTTWTHILGCDPSLYYIDGSLPPGLSLNLLSGDIGQPPSAYGTPIAAGVYTFTLSAYTPTCISDPAETNAQTFTITISPATSSSSPSGAANWSRNAGNPVLAPSTSGWDNGLIASPSVIKVGSTYMMYYEGQDKTTYAWHIGLATSTDGITWTRSASNPVLSPGSSGVWDEFEVRYPSVHYDGSTYRMWYWGRGSIDKGAMIGFATSSDGVSWIKHSTQVLGYGEDFEGNPVGRGFIPGSIIKSGSTYIMWYGTQYHDIERTTSSDGINWSTPQTVISGISRNRPVVILDNGVYRAWFTKWDTSYSGWINGSEARINIGYASSSDGITWTPYEQSTPLCAFCMITDSVIASLSIAAPGAWDRPGVGQPWVIKEGDQYKMWYTGGRIHVPKQYDSENTLVFAEGSIGYATSGGSAGLVKNSGTSSSYSSIQTAYNAASTGESLLIQAVISPKT